MALFKIPKIPVRVSEAIQQARENSEANLVSVAGLYPNEHFRIRPIGGVYNGLTIVFSQPCRFDTTRLLTGTQGSFFDSCLLKAGVSRINCDIRVADDNSPLLSGTKVVLLLGTYACHKYISAQEDTSLSQLRGNTYTLPMGAVAVGAFSPQDCMDIKEFERSLNPYIRVRKQQERLDNIVEDDGAETADNGDGDDSDKEDTGAEKTTKGVTKRSNFRFWFEQDCIKVGRLLKHGPHAHNIFTNLCPDINLVTHRLTTTKSEHVFIDIETDPNLNITCVGIGFDDNTVYVVPLKLYTQTLAYDELSIAKFLRALGVAMRDNVAVLHNGMFDLLILAWKYRVPYGPRIYDTMLAHSRIYPGTEKSLGHCISLYCDLPYHKNDGVFSPCNSGQDQQLWAYNGQDIVTTREVFRRQRDIIGADHGKRASVESINRAIPPYLGMTFKGMAYDADAVAARMAENDRRMMQLLRLIKLLVGYPLLPTSPKAVVKYFHTDLGYPPIGQRSKRTGNPSLGGQNLYMLLVKIDNPVIRLIISYRGYAKETGSLKFTPWIESPYVLR